MKMFKIPESSPPCYISLDHIKGVFPFRDKPQIQGNKDGLINPNRCVVYLDVVGQHGLIIPLSVAEMVRIIKQEK